MRVAAGMYERLGVQVEVWPVAADRIGIWLVSGTDAWRSEDIRQDTEPHRAVEDVLAENKAFTPEMAAALREVDRFPGGSVVRLVHSPSWRVDGESVVLTYLAIIECSSLVRHEWPEAIPVSTEALDAVGKPVVHEPTGPPTPRHIDVLAHGLRHLRFLLETDSQSRGAMDATWRAHLAEYEPSLSGMYEHG